MPNLFPIPTFREVTEANLAAKRLADDDRKYNIGNDGIVTESLIRKYSFMKESVCLSIMSLSYDIKFRFII